MLRIQCVLLSRNLFAKLFSVRTLYAPAALGVDGYVISRERVRSQFLTNGDSFRSKMVEFVSQDSKNLVFTEDLKNMIHIAETNPADLDLVVKMLKKFNAQNKEMRFGNYIFGPVVMRMFYHLNQADLALECFKDPDLDGFFDQLSTYQILLDLLFISGRYQDVLSTFELIQSHKLQDGLYPKQCICLVMAACYKLNTPESFNYSKKLWSDIQTVGHQPIRKATTFAAALAIKQNAPHIAMEICSSIRQQHYITVRNLKVLALTKLGRPDDAIPILRAVLEIPGDVSQMKHTFCRDVIDTIVDEMEKSNNKTTSNELNRIVGYLEKNGHITDDPIDDFICSEIVTVQSGTASVRRDQGILNAGFRNQSSNVQFNRQNRSPGRRPGLNDLY